MDRIQWIGGILWAVALLTGCNGGGYVVNKQTNEVCVTEAALAADGLSLCSQAQIDVAAQLDAEVLPAAADGLPIDLDQLPDNYSGPGARRTSSGGGGDYSVLRMAWGSCYCPAFGPCRCRPAQ